MSRFILKILLPILLFSAAHSAVISTTPAANASNAPVNTVISATFDTDMDPAAFTTRTFKVKIQKKRMKAKWLKGSVTYDAATRTASFIPAENLVPGRYQARIWFRPLGTHHRHTAFFRLYTWRFVVGDHSDNQIAALNISTEKNTLVVGESVQISALGTYEDGANRDVTSGLVWTVSDGTLAQVAEDGMLTGLAQGSVDVYATDGGSGTVSNTVTLQIAAPNDVNGSNFTAIDFGADYLGAIPPNATLQQYDEKTFCMLAGSVKDAGGNPLPGVMVSMLDHGEYGSVLTDENGVFVLPAEGGRALTVVFRKAGYLTVHRRIDAPTQEWANTPDVTMSARDAKVTTVDLTDPAPQLHASTPVTDDRGTRATTLVFDGVTGATVREADGTSRTLTSVDVRATEFETPESMPAALPAASAYTYCSDLQVDGVADDATVEFDAPVIMYVDNFLGFDVGEIVPVGYYDRTKGEWVGSDNGAVVQLLDVDGDGQIDALDSTGDGSPNDLDGDGNVSDEVAGLADNPDYYAGQTLWRAAITHFTPWDHNWPYGPPADAVQPDAPIATNDDTPPNDCKVPSKSYITVKTRVFHEDIPIAGTGMSLHYSSKRTEGYTYSIDVSYDPLTIPDSVLDVTIKAEVAGRVFSKVFAPEDVKTASFEWDGLDASERKVLGRAKVKISVGYRYDMVYYSAASAFAQAWARVGSVSTLIEGRSKIAYWSEKDSIIDVEARSDTDDAIANGWDISANSRAFGDFIQRGNGSIEKRELAIDGIITTVAGNGSTGYPGDGGKATEAFLYYPTGITADNTGNIYLADAGSHRIRKIDTDGIITTVAGNGLEGYSGDGGRATAASLNSPLGVAVDSAGNIYFAEYYSNRIRKVDTEGIITYVAGKGSGGYSGDGGQAIEASLYAPMDVAADNAGSIYIADSANHRIRKVDTDGIITTIAGNGSPSYSGDGGKATEASLSSPEGVAVDSAGNIYFTEHFGHRIRKIDTDGIITTVAGNGSGGYSGDGGKATEASLNYPIGVMVDNVGNIYIADPGNNRIRKVDTDGIITTVAGNGIRSYSSDGGKATEASLNYPKGVVVDSVGNIYVSDYGNHRIRKVSLPPLFQTYNLDLGLLLYKNRNNTADLFDSSGRYRKTIDLATNNTLTQSLYDAYGRLIAMQDRFGNTVTIDRDANGVPTSITAPNGQVTALTIDEQGNLTDITYEDNSGYAFTYFDGALMDTMTDPNGNQTQHVFDDSGRIIEEIDAETGSYRFLKNITGSGTLYSRILPEGETSTSEDVISDSGDVQSLMTLATGESITATFAKDERSVTGMRNGVAATYTYIPDELTQLKTLASKEITQPSGLKSTTTYNTTYDGNETHTDLKTQTVTSNAKSTTLVSDYTNASVTMTTPESRTTTLLYDKETLLTSSVQTGSLLPTAYTYDTKGRVTITTTGTRETSYTYDSRGNLATVTDPEGRTTGYTYDIMDRLTNVTYPDGTTEEYLYDDNANMTRLVTPTPTNHDFTFDGVDRKTSYSAPLGGTTTYAYNKSGRLTSVVRPSGKTISNTYDNGRLAKTTTPEGTTAYTYLFADTFGSISNASERVDYTYDGTLMTSLAYTGIVNQTIDYTYNNDFLPVSITYTGSTQSVAYDDDGLLTASGAFTLTRDAQNGYVTKVTDGTLTQSRSYNGYGELTAQSDNTFGYTLQRDDIGRITQKQESLDGSDATYTYAYDGNGKLVTVKKDGGEVESYTYDANGNRASATVNGTTSAGSYTLDDQLVVYGENTYLYDDDGYLSEKTSPEGTTAYEYGTLGELKSVTEPNGTVIRYYQNANNQRVAKEVNGVITEKYLWGDLTTLLAVYDGNDSLVQRFEYAGQRMPVAMTYNGTKYYLHYDQVGTLKAVSDTDGNIVKAITYDSFGNILSDSAPAFKVPFGFAGGLYDPDTGLTRFGYRDYDAETGKWTAKDPIGFDGGDTNLYGYVLGDPVNYIDPTGQFLFVLFPAIPVGTALVLDGLAWLSLAVYAHDNPPPVYHPMEWDKSWNDNAPYCAENLDDLANELGYDQKISPNKVPFPSHGKPAYKNKNGDYITPDRDGHKGGTWKKYNRKGKRVGTYNRDLSERIGK